MIYAAATLIPFSANVTAIVPLFLISMLSMGPAIPFTLNDPDHHHNYLMDDYYLSQLEV